MRKCHAQWVTDVQPRFGPGIGQRFADAMTVDPDDVERCKKQRVTIADAVARRTANGTIIALPAAPGPAYPIDLTGPPKDAVRAGTLALTSPAGLAGAPQITVRGSTVEGKPVGLGLLAARGMDEALLAMAAALDDR